MKTLLNQGLSPKIAKIAMFRSLNIFWKSLLYLLHIGLITKMNVYPNLLNVYAKLAIQKALSNPFTKVLPSGFIRDAEEVASGWNFLGSI